MVSAGVSKTFTMSRSMYTLSGSILHSHQNISPQCIHIFQQYAHTPSSIYIPLPAEVHSHDVDVYSHQVI